MQSYRSRSLSMLRHLGTALCVGYALLAASAAHAAIEYPVVASTDKGSVRGVATLSMKKYFGIPYAAPPVGALRWRPPQPSAPWSEVRDATEFANHCAQIFSPFGLPSSSEDCLYLNVYTPNHLFGASHDHAVMVWIHGGGFAVGQSEDFDPTKLVESQDVIVVTINYRLGSLGFLAHPALSAESGYGGSGNYGLMDQQAALRWVQNNIHNFGGDPNRVTIFGESAGGMSVHSQLASPLAAGLFDGAIIQSGAYALDVRSLIAAEVRGVNAATAFGCSNQSLQCLRSVPVDTLIANQEVGTIAFLPNLDGYVLPQTVRQALTSGQFNQVPVIQGSTRDEWRLFAALEHELVGSPITIFNYVNKIVSLGIPAPTASYLAANVYPLANYPTPPIAFAAVGTDFNFSCNGRASVRLLSQYVPTYAYEFNDPNTPQQFLLPVFPSGRLPYGAYHAGEIQYVLGVRPALPAFLVPNLNTNQQQLSDHMKRYWASFAKTGNPNSAGSPQWNPYNPIADTVQSLVVPTPTIKSDFAADHKCDFWTPGV